MSKKDENLDLGGKMKQLEEIRDWFAGPEFRLSEATEKYKKAIQLSAEIKNEAEKMTNEIEVLEEE